MILSGDQVGYRLYHYLWVAVYRLGRILSLRLQGPLSMCYCSYQVLYLDNSTRL